MYAIRSYYDGGHKPHRHCRDRRLGLTVDEPLAKRAEALMAAFAEVPVAAYAGRSHFVFLGGGANYGIALEGALKLQEMAITYTQGFHPGEYRHGPVSLVDARTAVVMLYRQDTRDDEAKP